MKIVITGANSFIGKRFAQEAVSQGHSVTLVMRERHKGERLLPDAEHIYLDSQDYGMLGEKAGACDCFVHLAWGGTRGEARMNSLLQEQNLKNSLAAVESVLLSGCRRIVTAGSQAEYGPHAGIISEESACWPNTEYGKAKLAFYREVADRCEMAGVRYCEPRFFSLYGVGDYSGSMINSVLDSMLSSRPCTLTQCIQRWDYLYLDDAAEALLRLCTAECPNGIYNFGSGDVRPLRDYILEMAEITGTGSVLQFGAVPYPATGMVSLWPDVEKLKTTLGWKPHTTFREGIQAIIQHRQRMAAAVKKGDHS